MSTEKSLQDLWTAYVSVPSTPGTSSGDTKILKTEFRFKEPIHCFKCSISNCLQCCCRNQGQKIRLLLNDLAKLLDLGFEDKIEGTYDTAENIQAFLDHPSKERIYRTPYLKRKTGKDGKEECIFLTEDWKCSIWESAPYICKTYPLIMDQEMTPDAMLLTFSLDTNCSCTRSDQMQEIQPPEHTKRLINDVVCERIEADHTSKLLCYRRDELKRIGFGKYL